VKLGDGKGFGDGRGRFSIGNIRLKWGTKRIIWVQKTAVGEKGKKEASVATALRKNQKKRRGSKDGNYLK